MNRWHVRQARYALRQGGVIAYPTETVFGLGCDPNNEYAVTRLLALKCRPWEKGLILLAADLEQLQPYIKPVDPRQMKKIIATWPGPVTWVFNASSHVPPWISGRYSTVAVRVTSHAVACDLCRQFGDALVSTSANLGGHSPTQRALHVRRWFGDTIDYLVPGEAGPYTNPSVIKDARTGAIIRPN